MKLEKKHWIIIGVVIAVIVIWYFFFKKKKTRDFPGLIVFGGGENRTLVLSKRYIDDYMFIALFKSALPQGASLGAD